jgi:hypothetical protein
MTEVWDKAPYKQSDLLVLLALADSANDEGVCWPSVPTLARRGRVKDRQVQKVLVRLEADGWLTRRERAGRSTIYTVMIPADAPSHRTPKQPESVPQDGLEGGKRPTGRGVSQDRGVLQDGGGVSPRTGGGVPQDTQNRKEPPSESSSSSSSSESTPSITTGAWRPRWSPSPESIAKVRAAHPRFTDMQLMLIADNLYGYCAEWKQKGVDKGEPSDRRYESWVKNEQEQIEKKERAEARERAEQEGERRSWASVAD